MVACTLKQFSSIQILNLVIFVYHIYCQWVMICSDVKLDSWEDSIAGNTSMAFAHFNHHLPASITKAPNSFVRTLWSTIIRISITLIEKWATDYVIMRWRLYFFLWQHEGCGVHHQSTLLNPCGQSDDIVKNLSDTPQALHVQRNTMPI